MQELQCTVAKQEATISQLQATMRKQETTGAEQQKEIKALSASLHKVSSQLELMKPAPRVVANDQ